MKRTKSIFAMTLLFVAISFFQGCGKTESSPSVTKTGYSLKPNEAALLDKLLRDEQAAFVDGGDSLLFGHKMPLVSAFDVAKQYEANQVAADQQFFKKKLQVSGVVESINSGIGNEPYISLRGVNQFMSPLARFAKGSLDTIAALQKGQKVSLLCEGGGAVVGVPIFKDCMFAKDYAAIKASDAKGKVMAFLSGESAKSDVVPKLAVASIAMARALPATSTCFSDGSKCNAELEASFNNDTAKSRLAAVSDELRKNGVPVPDTLK